MVWQIYSKFSFGHIKFEIIADVQDDVTSKVFFQLRYILLLSQAVFSSLFFPSSVMNIYLIMSKCLLVALGTV